MGERAAVDVNNDAVKSFALCLVDGQRIAELERELDKRAGFLFGYVAGFFINVIGERLPLFAADGNEFVVLKAADNDIAVFELFDNARGPVDVIGVVVFVKNDERSFLDGQNFRGGRILHFFKRTGELGLVFAFGRLQFGKAAAVDAVGDRTVRRDGDGGGGEVGRIVFAPIEVRDSFGQVFIVAEVLQVA